MKQGHLIFFCGKMGAGKSTKASVMAEQKDIPLVSEDEWLASLYPGKISSVEDYIHYSRLLKKPIKPLVQAILSQGVDVVMDYPANTLQQRQWLKTIADEIGACHTLIYLDVSDEICLERIAKRAKESPARRNTDTPDMFYNVTQYFQYPSEEEGLNIEMH